MTRIKLKMGGTAATFPIFETCATAKMIIFFLFRILELNVKTKKETWSRSGVLGNHLFLQMRWFPRKKTEGNQHKQ